MRSLKSAAAVLALLFFVISLYGCGKESTTSGEAGGATSGETTVAQDDGVYQGTIEKADVIDDSTVNLRFGCINNGIAYYICSSYDETEQRYREFVRPVDVKSGNPAGEDFFIKAGDEQISISSLAPCGDDAFVFTTMKYDADKDLSVFWVYKCSSDGTVLNKKDLSEIPQIPEGSDFYQGLVSDGSDIYLPSAGKLFVLGEGLGYKKTLLDSGVVSICLGSDGILYYLDNYQGDLSSYDPISHDTPIKITRQNPAGLIIP